ncbi:hypothetical protein OAO01_02875 [Oligoflexia bacterium]|nr:hypothetical protein [Oligoflexia bacterium]
MQWTIITGLVKVVEVLWDKIGMVLLYAVAMIWPAITIGKWDDGTYWYLGIVAGSVLIPYVWEAFNFELPVWEIRTWSWPSVWTFLSFRWFQPAVGIGLGLLVFGKWFPPESHVMLETIWVPFILVVAAVKYPEIFRPEGG